MHAYLSRVAFCHGVEDAQGKEAISLGGGVVSMSGC